MPDNTHIPSSRPVRIRSFEPGDDTILDALARAAFAQYQANYEDWEGMRRAIGSMSTMSGQGEILIAVDASDEMIGAVIYYGPDTSPRLEFFEPDWSLIRMLVVAPAARGQGIGRLLTEECVKRAKADGSAFLALHTTSIMQAALSIYLDMGFRFLKHVPDRFGLPYAVYLLDLNLSPAAVDGGHDA